MSLEELEQDLYERSDRDVRRREKRQEETAGKPRFNGRRERESGGQSGWMKEKWRIPVEALPGGEGRWRWVRRLRRWVPAAAAVIFVAAAAVGGYFVYTAIFSRGVSLTINLPEGEARPGVPFTVETVLENISGKTIQDVRVSLNLPEEIVFAKSSAGQKVITREVGVIGNGSITKETFELIAVGRPQTITQLSGRVIYKTGSLGSEFEVGEEADVSLGEPAVKIDLEAPRKVFSGERFDLNIGYLNMTEAAVGPVRIELEYPDGFNFVSASETLGGAKHNLFTVGEVAAGEKGTLMVTGTVVGPADSFFSVGVKAVMGVYGVDYTVSEQTASISVQPSPLALSIHLNDDALTAARPGDVLSYVLFYENNTSIGLEDVVITARLSGTMYDFGSLTGNGSFNSARRTITWNASNNRALTLLPPGASGTVSFSIKTLTNYPITRINDKDFELLAEAFIESSTVPEGVQAETTIGVAESIIKVAGKIAVDAQARFRDAEAGFVNEGPWPPIAEMPTQYTVRWALTNYATDVDEVEVSAFLGAGVRFTGNVKSNVAAAPQYNERTQEVVWKAGRVAATRGVVGAPVEAVFQIEAIPSAIMAGTFAPLMGETHLTATDAFTGEKLSASDGTLTTDLTDDSTITRGEGKVIKN